MTISTRRASERRVSVIANLGRYKSGLLPPPPIPPGILIFVGESIQGHINANPAGTTFLLQSGIHVNQTFSPKTGNEFYSQPGAILDGTLSTNSAVVASGNPSSVIIDGVIFENYAPGLIGPGSSGQAMIRCGVGGNWVVSNCEMRESTNLGMTFNGPNMQILNNHIHHNRQSNLKGFGNDGLVQGNEISFGNYLSEFPGGGEGGGTKFLETTRLILRNNNVHDNVNGLWCDFNNDQTIYEDNVVERNSNRGIFQEYGYNAIIRRNTVSNNGRGISIVSCDDADVHDNIVTEGTSWIWAVDRDVNNSGRFGLFRLRNLWIHDNTVTLTGGNRHGLRDNLQGSPNAWAPASNNLFDRNLYSDAGAPAAPFFWENNQTYTWGQWQAAGNDLNGSFT